MGMQQQKQQPVKLQDRAESLKIRDSEIRYMIYYEAETWGMACEAQSWRREERRTQCEA